MSEFPAFPHYWLRLAMEERNRRKKGDDMKKGLKNMYYGALIAENPEENTVKKISDRSKKLDKYPHLQIRWYSKKGKLKEQSTLQNIKISEKDWWEIENFLVGHFYELKDGFIVGQKQRKIRQHKLKQPRMKHFQKQYAEQILHHKEKI
jgi:hypothetical protein